MKRFISTIYRKDRMRKTKLRTSTCQRCKGTQRGSLYEIKIWRRKAYVIYKICENCRIEDIQNENRAHKVKKNNDYDGG